MIAQIIQNLALCLFGQSGSDPGLFSVIFDVKDMRARRINEGRGMRRNEVLTFRILHQIADQFALQQRVQMYLGLFDTHDAVVMDRAEGRDQDYLVNPRAQRR